MSIELGALSLPISVPRDDAVAKIRAIDQAAQGAGKSFEATSRLSAKMKESVDLLTRAEDGLRAKLAMTNLSLGERAKAEEQIAQLTRARVEIFGTTATATVAAAAKESAALQTVTASTEATSAAFGAMGNRIGRTSIAIAFGMEALANGTEGGMRRSLRAVATLGLAFGPQGLIVSAAALGLGALLDFMHRAEKEADEAYKRLKKKADDINAGPGGQESVDLKVVRGRLEKERTALAALQSLKGGDKSYDGNVRSAQALSVAGADDQAKKIIEQQQVVSTIEAQVRALERKDGEERVRTHLTNTARLAEAHHLSANEMRNFISERASFQRQLAELDRTGGAADQRATLVAQIKEIDDALANKKGVKALDDRVAALSTLATEHAATKQDIALLVSLEHSLTAERAAGGDSIERRVKLEKDLTEARRALLEVSINTPSLLPGSERTRQLGLASAATSGNLGVQLAATRLGNSVQDKDGKLATIDGKDLPASIEKGGKQAIAALERVSKEAVKPAEQLAASITNTIRDTLVSGLSSAFTEAFSGGGIEGFFKSAGKSVLSGLGSILVQMGEKLIPFGSLMTALGDALENPFTAGPAAIGIGVAMIALGSALGAAAKGGGSGGGGAGAGGYSAGGSGQIIDRGIINPNNPVGNYSAAGGGVGDTSSQAARGITARGTVNVTVIGPNDPVAQRQIQELIRNANRRGAV